MTKYANAEKVLPNYVLRSIREQENCIHARFALAMGDKGNLSLFGNNPLTHQLISEQFTSEYRVKTEGRGRKVDEWKLRPETSDNHWFDGIVGSAVAASMLGARLPSLGESDKFTGSDGSKRPVYSSGNRKILNPSGSRRILNRG